MFPRRPTAGDDADDPDAPPVPPSTIDERMFLHTNAEKLRRVTDAEYVRHVFKLFDYRGSSGAFVNPMASPSLLILIIPHILNALFTRYSDNGFLLLDQAKEAFKKVSPHLSAATIEQVFREIDTGLFFSPFIMLSCSHQN